MFAIDPVVGVDMVQGQRSACGKYGGTLKFPPPGPKYTLLGYNHTYNLKVHCLNNTLQFISYYY